MARTTPVHRYTRCGDSNGGEMTRVKWAVWAAGIALCIPSPRAAAQLSIQTIATSEMQAPGGDGWAFGRLRAPVINDRGDVLFGASENDTFSSRTGLWVGRPGSLQPLALKNQAAPDTGETFEFLYDSLLDDAGRALL